MERFFTISTVLFVAILTYFIEYKQSFAIITMLDLTMFGVMIFCLLASIIYGFFIPLMSNKEDKDWWNNFVAQVTITCLIMLITLSIAFVGLSRIFYWIFYLLLPCSKPIAFILGSTLSCLILIIFIPTSKISKKIFNYFANY